MLVSVVINPKAGAVNIGLLQEKISQALFRCRLHFLIAETREASLEFVKNEIQNKTDAFLICGGDGTINETLQMIMTLHQVGEIPPISLISSGTANDLSHELGISEKVNIAARMILEGKERKIDVIEVESMGVKKYMLTNGGFGIPAMTSDKANQLRSFLQLQSINSEVNPFFRGLSKITHRAVKKLGSEVYSALLAQSLLKWDQKNWNLEVEFEDGSKKRTQSPFLLINNQPYLGRKYLIAPFTNNSDGEMNLTMIESHNMATQILSVLKVLRGKLRESSVVNTKEKKSFTVRTLNNKRLLTFFGDGEILFRNAEEVKFKCLHQKLTVLV